MDRGRKNGNGNGNGTGKGCELCPGTARMYCESDKAMLCWECDARVHGANFLVARHTRALLCRTCQSPTPWRASGSRLGPSVSLCHRCSPQSQYLDDDLRRGGEGGGRSESESKDDDVDVDDDGDGEEDEGDSEMDSEDSAEEEEEEEEGENQVVPWSPPPPPPLTSSSSSEEEESSRAEIGAGSGGGSGSSLKRMRDNADLASHPQDDLPSSSMQLGRFPSAQPTFFGGTAADDNNTIFVGVGVGGGSNHAGFRLPKDRRRLSGHLVLSDPAQPPGSTRRTQPTTAGEPCGSSRAAISTIDFFQAT